MHILEIIPSMGSGGGERFVVDLCNELSKSNKVTLLVLHSLEKYHNFIDELDRSVDIICMNKKLGLDIGVYLRLTREIRRLGPDIIHTHLAGILYTSFFWLFNGSIPIVHTVHNDAKREAAGCVKKYMRKIAFKSGRVKAVTISEESQRSFIDFYHCESTMIYNGRPAFFYEPFEVESIKEIINNTRVNPDSKILVNVARLQEQKNQIAMTKAVMKLNAEGNKIEVYIVGDTVDENVKIAIEKLKCPYVHIMGAHKRPILYILAADAFTLPSKWEGMPISLIECFSVGAIPVCTNAGGVKNMIKDNVNGISTNDTSVEGIIELYKRYYELSDIETNRIKKNSMKSFEDYTIQKCGANYINLFKSYAPTNS